MGVTLGVISALKKYTWIDSLVLTVSMFFTSIPSFCVALVLIYIFSVSLGWLPSGGIDTAAGYVLPMVVIGLHSLSNYTRITRSSMLEVIGQDYIRTARAKGQTEGKITTRHAMRNALFRSAGMHTVSVSTFSERHSAYWFNAGFNETINVGKIGGETAQEVMPGAMDWIGRCGKTDDWFMHIHMWDPHSPYNTPMDFGNPFEDEPAADWITQEVLEEHKKHVGPHSINELSMFDDKKNEKLPRTLGKGETLEDVKKIIDGYDCGVRNVDTQVGHLIDLLKRMNIYEDTAIIITADHGENLGELGIYSEHATADHTTTHIPLIIKWPGMAAGVDQGFHYNIDLTRTMADLLMQEPVFDGDGESFIDTLKDGKSTGRSHLIVSQCAHVCQRSVRFEDYIYIRTYHDGYHLFPKEMLFNLETDVHEQYNLATEQPELCNYAARLLLDWEQEMMLTSESETDPMWTVIRDGGPFNCSGRLGEYIERLKNTGRSEGAAELARRHPDEVDKKKVFPHVPYAILKNAH